MIVEYVPWRPIQVMFKSWTCPRGMLCSDYTQLRHVQKSRSAWPNTDCYLVWFILQFRSTSCTIHILHSNHHGNAEFSHSFWNVFVKLNMFFIQFEFLIFDLTKWHGGRGRRRLRPFSRCILPSLIRKILIRGYVWNWKFRGLLCSVRS